MCEMARRSAGNAALLPGPPYVARPRYVSGCDGLTERGASATLEALSLGASDYATKPDNVTSPAEARENIPAELIPKIKSLCRAGGERRTTPRSSTPGKIVRPNRRRLEIVAIGTSTGGPNALAKVLPSILRIFRFRL
jgi:two-component system chemotaxis response regulator CheB